MDTILLTFAEKKGRLVLAQDVTIGGVTIPKGFETDLDSVPSFWLTSKLFKHQARQASIVHDYLYSTGQEESRKEVDKLFYRMMRDIDKVPKWKAKVMYGAVRLFGGKEFRK